MHLHEYQAKELLRERGIPLSDFVLASTIDDVWKLVEEEGWKEAVVKAQVHAGGRGKAGGVKLAKNGEEVVAFSREMLGKRLVTAQTGEEGVPVNQVLLTKPLSIRKEYYLAITIDRTRRCPVLIASSEGGVEIEAVAHKDPSQILRIPLPRTGKLRNYHLIHVGKQLGWEGEVYAQGCDLLQRLVKLFFDTDASLFEINPLVLTEEGTLQALDAKANIDDNALFRHPRLAEMHDATQLSPAEATAHAHGLAYVAMEGDIGCMVNGAGLAMATMDIIAHYGGHPANFLDVGGSASQEKIAEGFKILLSDQGVKAILVNIFGGIMNCVTLAAGIITAVAEVELKVPLIVRMEGTHVEEGKKILADAGMDIVTVDDLNAAADRAVLAARGLTP